MSGIVLHPYLTQDACCRKMHRSEEHTSELQSPCNLVCRLLLEKKKALIFGAILLLVPVMCGEFMPHLYEGAVLLCFFFLNTGAPEESTLFPPQILLLL